VVPVAERGVVVVALVVLVASVGRVCVFELDAIPVPRSAAVSPTSDALRASVAVESNNTVFNKVFIKCLSVRM